MVRTLLVYVVLSVISLALAARDFPLRMLKPVELPLAIEMTCVYFDHKGLMWIGTSSGLIRYDGCSMHTIRSNQEHQDLLPNNSVMSMVDDGRGSFWVGTRNGVLRIERESGRCRTYHIQGNNRQIVYALYATHDGQVWAGTNNGVCYYDAETDSFASLGHDNCWFVVGQDNRKNLMPDGCSVKSFVESGDGKYLYIGTWANGLLRLDLKTFRASKKKQKVVVSQLPLINGRNKAYSLCMDSKGRLWIGSWGGGICCLQNPLDFSNPMPVAFNSDRDDFNCIYNMVEDSNNHLLWACSREGLVTVGLDDLKSASTNYPMPYLSWIEKDAIGNIWVQGKYGSIQQVSTAASPFRHVALADPQAPQGYNSVYSIFTADGNVFYASLMPYGLARYDRSKGMTSYNTAIPPFSAFHPGLFKSPIKAIVGRRNGDIWMGSEFYGIFCLREQGKAYEINKQNTDWIHDNCVNAFYELDDGKMLVGTSRGLFLEKHLFPKGKVPLNAQGRDLSASDIRHIARDHRGVLWLATENNGIISLTDPVRPRCRQYAPTNRKFAVPDATAVIEDARHNLWAISNSGGLFLYDKASDAFASVNTSFHLENDEVYAINEDMDGNVWFTTAQGLARLSFGKDSTPHLKYYTTEDGLGNMLFPSNSTFRFGDEMFFGTSGGFVSFSPADFRNARTTRRETIFVSDLLIDNQSIATLPEKTRMEISEKTPEFVRHITIPATTDKFSVVFALLSYVSPENNKYAYRLEGYQQDWYYLPKGEHAATFMNLPSGKYKLYIKAAGNNGIWQQLDYPIEITILPPWYASWWAFLLYAAFAALTVWGAFRLYRRHLNTRNQLRMTSVFTSIAHDLLTPLTVISLATEKMRAHVPEMEEYESIQNNIMRLSRLLRQILEIRKSQTGRLVLKAEQGDVSDFICKTVETLRPLAESKRITLETSVQPSINGWFDRDKLDKIVYNLLSNATKYTPVDGSIHVKAGNEEGTLVLSVSDNGIGISEEQQKHLYQNFFDGEYRQMNTTGTGIGLALVGELVALHHGTISCRSEVGKGTTFTVILPLHESAYSSAERVSQHPIQPATETGARTLLSLQRDKDAAETGARTLLSLQRDKDAAEAGARTLLSLHLQQDKDAAEETETPGSHTILFVEDNAELLSLMQSALRQHYRILTASNGEKALRVIAKEDIDCVVSDVMMPVMDGITLTRKIKADPDTKQLPVVLLTARTSDEQRNEGFLSGADEYITKPFKIEDLRLRIDNIIANRERIRERFARQTDYHVENEHYSSPDQIFIEKAFECVRKHLADTEYGREQFALDMCVSSSTLYNKLRALTGQNVSAFITSVRLKESCRILKARPDISVTELSTLVGFNTPHYFSRCFKKEFGMNPTDYIDKQHAKDVNIIGNGH